MARRTYRQLDRLTRDLNRAQAKWERTPRTRPLARRRLSRAWAQLFDARRDEVLALLQAGRTEREVTAHLDRTDRYR